MKNLKIKILFQIIVLCLFTVAHAQTLRLENNGSEFH